MSQLKIPAITRELEFIATHIEEADDIADSNVKVDPLLKRLSDSVYERAEADAEALLDHLKDSMEQGADGLRINNWHWPRYEWPWEIYSDIYSGAKGRRKRIGWAGLHVGYGKEDFRLIGFMVPRLGGLEGQKKLALICKKKIRQVHLTRDDQKRYPGWNDCIIWFDRKLTLGTSHEELGTEVRKQTKKFFKVAKPLLTGK